jgi:hypothetical protein
MLTSPCLPNHDQSISDWCQRGGGGGGGWGWGGGEGVGWVRGWEGVGEHWINPGRLDE